MKSLLKLSSILMILSAFFACDKNPATPSFKSLMIDRDAKKSAVAKKDEDAMSAYYKILESDPELSEVHSNIGVLFMQGKKIEDASKSLNQALKLADQHKDPKAQFVVHYNLGVFYGAQKKVPEALEHYQAALELNPTSKETKHNIELLIQSNSSDQSKDGDKKDSDQKNKDGKSDDKSKNGKDNKDQKDKDQDKKEDKDKDKEKKEDKDGKDEKDKKD
ncbi:MAG: tetratricopeptide repeat protein, partial [Bdellovibrio sp.]|nr:tetratricopeptide repeat protein [Bdellovibrio sp.]